MNDQTKEHLSAWMDGELSREEARFLQRRIENTPELAEQWERWHRLRDLMQGRGAAAAGVSLVGRVSTALAEEAAPGRAWLGNGLRWATGMAVAASVAVAALLVIPGIQPSAPLVADAPQAVAPANSEVVVSGLSERDLRPSLAPVTHSVAAEMRGIPGHGAVQVDPRIEGWLIRHNAAHVQSVHDSFVPFIPVLSPYRPVSQPVMVDGRDSPR